MQFALRFLVKWALIVGWSLTLQSVCACGDGLPVVSPDDAGLLPDVMEQDGSVEPDRGSPDQLMVDGADPDHTVLPDTKTAPDNLVVPDKQLPPDLKPPTSAPAGTMAFQRMDISWSRKNVALINGACQVVKTKSNLKIECGVFQGYPPSWTDSHSLKFQFILPPIVKAGQTVVLNSTNVPSYITSNYARVAGSMFPGVNDFFFLNAANTATITITVLGSAKYSAFKATGQAILYGKVTAGKLKVTFNLDTTLD